MTIKHSKQSNPIVKLGIHDMRVFLQYNQKSVNSTRFQQPLLFHQYTLVPSSNKTLGAILSLFQFIENKVEKPVSELVQLCYVMPRQSLQFLPNKLYNAIIKNRLEQYKTDCDFSWAYCKYFWECHSNLPYIDVNELEEFVNNNK